jgi:5-methylthioribose kinase
VSTSCFTKYGITDPNFCSQTNFHFPIPELDQFVDPLRATCTLKVKANSVKQEYEKQDELKRSALRAVAALLQIPKAGELILNF